MQAGEAALDSRARPRRPSREERDTAIAFDEAAAAHAKRLFALAMTIVGEPTEAQDVVQNTLVSAWSSWSRRRESDPAGWLTRICVNEAIATLRQRRRAHRAVWRYLFARPPDSAYRETFAAELVDLDRACRRLSPRQRAVFALHFQYGFTVAQCAELIGCRPGTARSHLGRAVANIRKELSS